MALIRTVSNANELRSAVSDISTIVQVHAGVAEHVVVIRARQQKTNEMIIISIRDEAFEEPSAQGPMIHAHGDEDFHEHSYIDYVNHPVVTDERLPAF